MNVKKHFLVISMKICFKNWIVNINVFLNNFKHFRLKKVLQLEFVLSQFITITVPFLIWLNLLSWTKFWESHILHYTTPQFQKMSAVSWISINLVKTFEFFICNFFKTIIEQQSFIRLLIDTLLVYGQVLCFNICRGRNL